MSIDNLLEIGFNISFDKYRKSIHLIDLRSYNGENFYYIFLDCKGEDMVKILVSAVKEYNKLCCCASEIYVQKTFSSSLTGVAQTIFPLEFVYQAPSRVTLKIKLSHSKYDELFLKMLEGCVNHESEF